MMDAIEVACAALFEAGRADLAELVIGFEDEGGFYLEVMDELAGGGDWAVVDRAEALARQSLGQRPLERAAR
jgi:hypothetical protein